MAGRAALLCVVLLLGTSRPATALTILDVIQLSQRSYTDAQIIAIIEATNAVFELEVEDLPRLKQLGVSEVVIRVMLQRRPPPSTHVSGGRANPGVDSTSATSEPPVTAPGSRTALADVAQRVNAQRQAARSVNAPALASTARPIQPAESTPPLSRGTASAPMAAFFPVAEDRAGHHAHVGIALRGLTVFVLRDEASYGSIAERAEALAAQLEAARVRGTGEFQHARIGGKDTVVFRSADAESQLPITSVTSHDARAMRSAATGE